MNDSQKSKSTPCVSNSTIETMRKCIRSFTIFHTFIENEADDNNNGENYVHPSYSMYEEKPPKSTESMMRPFHMIKCTFNTKLSFQL